MNDLITLFNDLNHSSDVGIIIMEEIMKINDDAKTKLRKYLLNLISSHPTHIITAGYTFGNLSNRPHNKLVTITKNGHIEALFNYNPLISQLILLGEPSPLVCDTIKSVIAKITKMFLFCSGTVLFDLVKNNFNHTKSLENIVYRLDKTKLPPSLDTLKTKLVIKGIKEEIYTHVQDYYHYKLEEKEDKLASPHYVIFEDDQIIAASRANQFSPEISIIGGVYTELDHRKKGHGMEVSLAITQFLADHSETVALETDLGNFPAQRIYESIGFIPVGKSGFFELSVDVIGNIIGERDY
jgi:GNAT superfamily N-acetyltransferase